MESTGRALVEHWNWAKEKGLVNNSTAITLRVACEKVLEIDEGWETLDITTIDLSALLDRFRNLKGREYKPESLSAYMRRFRLAHQSFLDYLRDPSTWKYASRPQTVKKQKGTAKSEASEEDASSLVGMTEEVSPTISSMVDYPFPLRPGCIARLRLPVDLKTAETKRLAAFMLSLVVDIAGEN